MDSYINKYNLKNRGANLESTNPLKAIEYYTKLLTHEYFINDYYPYRRLVLMYEKINEPENIILTIEKFMKSNIYCNEYNFLWFEHKLQLLSDEDYIKREKIADLTNYFKNNGGKNKKMENIPLPIADRIKKQNRKIIIETEKSYNKRQKQYEYEIRLSELKRQNKDSEYIELLNHMIYDLNYKKINYIKRLCYAYKKINDRDGEIKTIKEYLKTTKRKDKWFEKRLKDLETPRITFNLENVDLNKNPFYEYSKKLDENENIKRKAILIEYGKTLSDLEAISYYKYLCNNTYFSNDWYPYRKLTELYDTIKDYNANLVNIKKLFQSKIYLNDYQFIWFSEKLRLLQEKTNVDDETIEKWFDDYQINGAINKYKLNKYLGDKFINENNSISILTDDEFDYTQELNALKEKGLIYERVENYELAIKHYILIINDKRFNYLEFYKKLCDNLEKIKDYKRELKAIGLYYTIDPIDKNENSDEFFLKKLSEVNEKLNTNYTVKDLKSPIF